MSTSGSNLNVSVSHQNKIRTPRKLKYTQFSGIYNNMHLSTCRDGPLKSFHDFVRVQSNENKLCSNSKDPNCQIEDSACCSSEFSDDVEE